MVVKGATNLTCLFIIIFAQVALAFARNPSRGTEEAYKCSGASCKPAASPPEAVLNAAEPSCPGGYVLEQDTQGLYQCVKYTPQPYPSNAASKEAVGLKPDESGSSRRLRSLGSAVSSLVAPAVTITAERVQPVVVLPKPLASINVPNSIDINADLPLRFWRPKMPIVVLPQPALSFIQPSIDITLPSLSLPQRDLVIPVLPAPTVSFTPPDLSADIGGVRIQKKFAVIDASRLGPRTTYDVNLPSRIQVDLPFKFKADVKPPAQTVIDLSSFGPRDATVVRLPDVKVNLSSLVSVVHDPAKVHVVNLGAAQQGPVYDIKLPGLPQRNKVNINLPRLNFSSITLPGHREKENVVFNVGGPKLAPTHEITLKIDASQAGLGKLPLLAKISGPQNNTNINIVTLPPVTVPALPPLLTLDLRKNATPPRV